jgi:hypothetical protein
VGPKFRTYVLLQVLAASNLAYSGFRDPGFHPHCYANLYSNIYTSGTLAQDHTQHIKITYLGRQSGGRVKEAGGRRKEKG